VNLLGLTAFTRNSSPRVVESITICRTRSTLPIPVLDLSWVTALGGCQDKHAEPYLIIIRKSPVCRGRLRVSRERAWGLVSRHRQGQNRNFQWSQSSTAVIFFALGSFNDIKCILFGLARGLKQAPTLSLYPSTG